MGTILFLALATCSLGGSPSEVTRRSITVGELPAPARATMERYAKGHPLRQLAEVQNGDCSIDYEARVRRGLGEAHDVAVGRDGRMLGDWTTELSGDGP